jgi:hypothetical protein
VKETHNRERERMTKEIKSGEESTAKQKHFS